MASILNFLQNVPLFRELGPEDLKQISASLEVISFAKDCTVFKQGDSGDAFYVVAAGEANVMVCPSDFIKVGDEVKLTKDLTFAGKVVPSGTLGTVEKYDPARDFPYTVRVKEGGQRGRVCPEEINLASGNPADKFVAKLKPGDYFGEASLLRGKPRNATIVAVSDMKCAMLNAKKFQELQLGSKLSFAKRKAIQNFDNDKGAAPKGDTKKSDAEVKLVSNAILTNKKLMEIVTLPDAELDALVAGAWKRDCKAGETIISQGDIQADEFFIVKSGTFAVSVGESNCADAKKNAANVVGKVPPGASFGELALLYQAPRAATVTCETAGSLFVIDRVLFKTVLRKANEARINGFYKVVDSIKLFNCLLSDEKETLAAALVETHFIKGEVIIKEGDTGDVFYILVRGKVQFSKGGKEIALMDADKQAQGSFFGERSLLKKEPRAATATVLSEDALALALTKDRFEELLGSLEEMIKETEKGGRRKSRVGGVKAGEKRRMDTIKMTDLKRLGLLGCGGFGAVTLEQHKTTGATYALKKLSKGFIVQTNMQQGTKREKDILAMCDSDFIVKLYATFQDSQSLYLLLEAALGGELYATYHKHRFHGDVKKAKFYAASVVFCFEHLHQRNILYRDLKPENLLLDGSGAAKMTDMGLAKIVIGKTYTTCGTPDYFAPEVIQQSGIGKGVDWWTLGILMHELISGHAPFEANDPMETYQKIVRGVSRVRFTYKDADAIDLVKNMLKHQPSERLPMRVGGTKNLKGHAWFKGFNWEMLANRTMEPPYKPEVKSATDMSNFRATEADLPPEIKYKDDGSGWCDDF